jgi:hypothetical protein
MKLLVVALAVMLTGCTAIKMGQSPLNLTGDWQVTLSESQASLVSVPYGHNDYPNTVIDLALIQSGSALSVSKTMIASAGCGQSGIGAWWEIVGWNQDDLSGASGIVDGYSLALKMDEGDGTGTASAQLTFTGTVSQDGKTSTGTLSDGCTGGQTVEWSAVRINTFPD